MKSLIYLSLFAFLLPSCTIDNYDMPDLMLSGKIVDVKNNELVESGGVNAGSIVRLFTDNSTQSLLYKTKPDGTFMNSKVFRGKYNYTAEGPFTYAATPVSLTMTKNTEIEIKVTPNVRLKSTTVTSSGTTATIKVVYEKGLAAQTLAQLGIVWSSFSHPNALSFAGGNIILQDVSAQNLSAGEQVFTINNLTAGMPYYVRAVARTNNPGNYYNYSTQLVLNAK